MMVPISAKQPQLSQVSFNSTFSSTDILHSYLFRMFVVAQGVAKIPDGGAQILTGAGQAFAAKHHDDDHEQDQQMPDMNATQSPWGYS